MQIYTLPHPTPLELRLTKTLGKKINLASWKIFSNGENFVRVKNVESEAIVLGRAHPPGDNFFQTLLLVDTLKRSGAKKISVYLPFFGYSRQDRQLIQGESVAAGCLVNALKAAGATQIVTLDLHSIITSKESAMPIKNVSFMSDLAQALSKEIFEPTYTVVSPDRGGLDRAVLFAQQIKDYNGVAWIEKKRVGQGAPHAMKINGKLSGRTAILVDDMLDTGKTISEAVKILRKRGVRKFYLCVTHPIFSDGAAKLIRSLKFEKIFTSNTLPLPKSIQRSCNITVLDATRRLSGII